MPMFNPVVTPDYLSKMGSVSPLYAIQADNAFQRAEAQDQASLADMMSGFQHEQAMRPLKQESQRLSNETSEAQIPGLRALSSMNQRKDKMEGITFDADVKSRLAELATRASDAEMKQFETGVQRMMYSADPKERERGFKLFEASKHMYEIRQKQKFDAEENQKQRDAQIQAANIAAASRAAAAEAKATRAGSVQEAIARMGFEKAAVYFNYLSKEAAKQNNVEEAQYYAGLADEMKQANERAKILAAQQAGGGKIDPAATAATGEITVRPGAEPQGFSREPQANTKVYTIEQLKQRYPNFTEQQIRDAAKARGIEIR